MKRKFFFLIPLCLVLLSGCGAAWKAKPRVFVNNSYLSNMQAYLVKKPLRVGVTPLAYHDKNVSMKVTDIFTSELPMIPIIRVVERNRLKTIIEEQALSHTGVMIWSGNHTLHSGPLSVPDTQDSLVPFTIRELVDELNRKTKLSE